ncbi:MAG: metallophosphoesterase [Polyangiaceae bacterium]|nr:metallophosphoesterase [Polyangiaceae bacterium]
MRFRRALLLSDIHLGWSVCTDQHEVWLERLPEAVDDAELVVLNGDVLDHHRGFFTNRERELEQRLLELIRQFVKEGRRVVYVEGNHDVADAERTGLLTPDRWHFDWEGAHGEQIRVLHGHRFSNETFTPGAYERFGRHLLWAENYLYATRPTVRNVYGGSIGFLVGAIGWTEDVVWKNRFPGRVQSLLTTDVLVHGHFHFGPGHWKIGKTPVWKTGAWVSHGHLGSMDRMLRYRDGKFERITLGSKGFYATNDGL